MKGFRNFGNKGQPSGRGGLSARPLSETRDTRIDHGVAEDGRVAVVFSNPTTTMLLTTEQAEAFIRAMSGMIVKAKEYQIHKDPKRMVPANG